MLINNISGCTNIDELRVLLKDKYGSEDPVILKSELYKYNIVWNNGITKTKNYDYPNNYVVLIRDIVNSNKNRLIVIDADQTILNKLSLLGIVPDNIIYDTDSEE